MLKLLTLGFKTGDLRPGNALAITLFHRCRLLTGALVVNDIPAGQQNLSRRKTALSIRAVIGVVINPPLLAVLVEHLAQSRRSALACRWNSFFQWRAFRRANPVSSISRMVIMKCACGLGSPSQAMGQWMSI
ncbi:hypothetical protein GGE24_003336 [Bradyrhizobium centrosematis]|nr:hypothetical protein [Bradyrhizobium centrosematis]MCS3765277.1 hypothetical protein [Bradyrhizobium centrosematis]MCS3774024.1 hypothetical protein [Bradyrhizobium centrosematis]